MATMGETRVRTSFNPSNNSLVDQIKQKSAELINLCQTIPRQEGTGKDADIARLVALAQTHYEDAAMWAVKAATA
jgi:hypothetical protein